MSVTEWSDRARHFLRSRTLRGKVSLLGLVVITGWVVALTISFNFILAFELKNQADDALRNRAATVEASVVYGTDGISAVRASDASTLLNTDVWVYRRDGSALERPSAGEDVQTVADDLASGPSRYASLGDENRLFALPLYQHGERAGAIVVSVSLDAYRRASHVALIGSSLVALLVLIGSYPVVRLAAGRALRPVDAMTAQASDWSANAVGERFGDQQYRELQSLASNLDGVLDRLSAVLRHERQLSAELSHELRTPLARVIAETDLLMGREQDPQQLAESLRSIRDSALAMERILETLLAAARAEVASAPGRSDLATAVGNAIAAVAPPPGVTVRSSVGALSVGADAAVVERVLAPILGNACRYARSRVTVSARQHRDAVVITVDDDGPGVPEQLREAIFEPGLRGDPDDGHDGAGLGLALARRLARAAAGDVVVTGPQSSFEVRLPRA